jgi:magnesium transporter
MLMDAGGNAGSQTNVSVVRSLSIQELDFQDLFRVMWKEFRVSVLCGITMAVVNFAKLLLLDRVGLLVALVVSVALICTVVISKLLGCLFPMAAKKLNLDPALVSSPVVTTIADVVSLIIYFLLASALLSM